MEQHRADRAATLALMTIVSVTAAVVFAAIYSAPPTAREPRIIQQPASGVVNFAKGEVTGNRAARVGLIEFGNLLCKYCGVFARESWPLLKQKYVDNGQLVVAFMYLLGAPEGPFPSHLAKAADCAGTRNGFWEFRDAVFALPSIDLVSLDQITSSLGIADRDYSDCLAAHTSAKLADQSAIAYDLQVESTPTFFLGYVEGERMRLVSRFAGDRSLELLDLEIQRLLDRLSR
jgi:protein-disulfide isomerase